MMKNIEQQKELEIKNFGLKKMNFSTVGFINRG